MSLTRYTLGDISRSLPPEKRKEELRTEWMVSLIYRPLGNILAFVLLRLSVKANQVTLTGLVLALSLPFIALNRPENGYIVVGLLGFLISTLDCVDGTIARMTKQEGVFGRYLDAVTDMVARGCLFASVGLLVDRGLQTPEWLAGFGLDYCLGAALLFYAARLSRLFADRFAGEDKKKAVMDRGWIDRFVFPFMSGLDWALPILILIAGSFDALGWIALWLLLHGALDFLYTQFAVLKRLA